MERGAMDDYSSVNVAHPEEGSPMKSIRGGVLNDARVKIQVDVPRREIWT